MKKEFTSNAQELDKRNEEVTEALESRATEALESRVKTIVAAYNSGDKGLREWSMIQMMELTQGFIGHMIKKHFSAFMAEHYQDLYNEGVLAVMESMGGLDLEKGTITTYFTPRILHAMSNYINNETNKSTAYYSNIMNKIKNAIKYFEERQIHPTISDLSLHTGLSIKKIEDGMRRINAVDELHYNTEAELDAVMQTGTGSPEEKYLENERMGILAEALCVLCEQDREIISWRFGFKDGAEKSFQAIAKAMHLPVNQVTASLNRSIRILQSNCGLRNLVGAGPKIYRNHVRNGAEISFVPDQSVMNIYADLDDEEETEITISVNHQQPKDPYFVISLP